MHSIDISVESDERPDMELYQRFAPTILQGILRQVPHQQDAEDLLLEVFLAALRNPTLVHLAPERQLAWLRKVARNKIVDRYRRLSLFKAHSLEIAHEQEDQAMTPEQFVVYQERVSLLQQTLNRLSSVQQQLLYLRYSHELPLAEIALVMGRSYGSVRKLLARTLRQLQKQYVSLEKGGL
jgi:RNA polymerase sigma-70 factor (ECF subfamily)